MKVKNNLHFQSLLMLTKINLQWYRYTFIYHNVIYMNWDLISHEELSLYTEFYAFFCCKKKGFSWIFPFLFFYLIMLLVVRVCVFCYLYKCNLIKWFLFSFFSLVFSSSHIFIIYILLSFLILFVCWLLFMWK